MNFRFIVITESSLFWGYFRSFQVFGCGEELFVVYSSWVRTMRKARKWKINKVRLLIYAVIVLLIVYFAVSAMRIVRLSGERDEVYAYNEELQQEKESLQLKLENISSPDYIESLARSDLKLVKANELLFMFSEEYGDSDEAEKAAKDEKADDAKTSEDKSEDKQSSEKETDDTKDTDNGENKN